MKVVTEPKQDYEAVAAFPDRRLRHFQKQGSVKDELKWTRSQVQIELKLQRASPSELGDFGSPHWNAVTGVTRFASSNLARSATTSGSDQTSVLLDIVLMSAPFWSSPTRRFPLVAALPEYGTVGMVMLRPPEP